MIKMYNYKFCLKCVNHRKVVTSSNKFELMINDLWQRIYCTNYFVRNVIRKKEIKKWLELYGVMECN